MACHACSVNEILTPVVSVVTVIDIPLTTYVMPIGSNFIVSLDNTWYSLGIVKVDIVNWSTDVGRSVSVSSIALSQRTHRVPSVRAKGCELLPSL